MSDEIDRIIARAAGWLPDTSGCPPNCEYCERDLKEAAPALRTFHAVLKAAGYVIVPSTEALLQRGADSAQ